MRLLTGKPGWSTSADVVVIGSGVAGLTTALNLRSHDLSVLLVTKATIDEGSTKWAQGGIAAALGPGDTPGQHKKDTLIALFPVLPCVQPAFSGGRATWPAHEGPGWVPCALTELPPEYFLPVPV